MILSRLTLSVTGLGRVPARMLGLHRRTTVAQCSVFNPLALVLGLTRLCYELLFAISFIGLCAA
jgi:hypothetical protein